MAIAHNNLGMVYGKTGQTENAIGEFRKSLELDPRSPRSHTNLGIMLYQLGEHEEARLHWQEALRLNPQFQEARRVFDLLREP
jgi:Flp pilus assembly protein TadD